MAHAMQIKRRLGASVPSRTDFERPQGVGRLKLTPTHDPPPLKSESISLLPSWRPKAVKRL